MLGLPFFHTIALVVAALVPIINPVGSAPIFLSMTQEFPSQALPRLARRIAMNVFVLLVAATFVGTYVLEFFGLSLSAIQIGGGLLVASNGWKLLRGEENDEKKSTLQSNATAEARIRMRAFYPLTFPLTAGPGTISVAIALGASLPAQDMSRLALLLAILLGILLVTLSVYLSYRFAHKLLQWLGATGAMVLLRFSAFILICVGVQILTNGVGKVVEVWIRHSH